MPNTVIVRDRLATVIDEGCGLVQVQFDDGAVELLPQDNVSSSEMNFQLLEGVAPLSNIDKAKLKRYQVTNASIASGDMLTINMVAADNMIDRSLARWTPESLKKLANSYKGYPLQLNHDSAVQSSVGVVFDAEVFTFTDSIPAYFTNTAGNGGFNKDIVRNEGYHALVLQAAVQDTADMRKMIGQGVNKVSLGYTYEDIHCPLCGVSFFDNRCPHGIAQTPEQQKDDRYAPYRNKVRPYDIYEVSLVAEPNLPRAGVIAGMHRHLR